MSQLVFFSGRKDGIAKGLIGGDADDRAGGEMGREVDLGFFGGGGAMFFGRRSFLGGFAEFFEWCGHGGFDGGVIFGEEGIEGGGWLAHGVGSVGVEHAHGCGGGCVGGSCGIGGDQGFALGSFGGRGGEGVGLCVALSELEEAIAVEAGGGVLSDDLFEGALNLAGVLKAVVRFFFEEFEDHLVEGCGDTGRAFSEGFGLIFEDGVDQGGEHITEKRALSGAEFVHNDAKGEEVGAEVLGACGDLFGGHIGRGAFDDARLSFVLDA